MPRGSNPNSRANIGKGAPPIVKGGRTLSVRISPEQAAKLDAARGGTTERAFVRAWLESLLSC